MTSREESSSRRKAANTHTHTIDARKLESRFSIKIGNWKVLESTLTLQSNSLCMFPIYIQLKPSIDDNFSAFFHSFAMDRHEY